MPNKRLILTASASLAIGLGIALASQQIHTTDYSQSDRFCDGCAVKVIESKGWPLRYQQDVVNKPFNLVVDVIVWSVLAFMLVVAISQVLKFIYQHRF
jgi:hypothetical protein